MATTTQLSEHEQTRTTRLAAAAFVIAPVIVLAFWLSGEPGYENPLFTWQHASVVVSGVVLALGVTALLYAGGRRLGVAGLAGAAFAYVGVATSALWVPIAWQATVFARADSSSLGVFTALFSPMGSAYFVSVMGVYALAVAGLSLGLYRAGLAHRVPAGLGALVGVVSAVWMGYTLVAIFPEPITGVTIALTVLQWAVVIPLGVSLYRRSGRPADATDAQPQAAHGADD
ncbi:MAG: hypothetical protein ABEJ89_04155 [Haloarculaceae archaeon]